MLLVLASALCASSCADERTVWSIPASTVDSVVEAALRDGPLVGASVSVALGDEVVFDRGYGWADLAVEAPVTPETRFNVASVGKVVAAATVMTLVERGLVDLDTEVVALLPELADVPALASVRLRHLLSMTSGLPDYVDDDFDRWVATREPLDPAFVLRYVRAEPRVFDPGTQWMYSNTGFYLAGLVVERVTGRPWGDVVSRDVLPMLGLGATGLCDDMGDERSKGYERTDTGFVASVVDQETGVRGDAGLCATTHDLASMPGRFRERGISASSLERMTAPTRLENGITVDYGLGVARGRLFGRPLWGHMGGSGSIVAVLGHFATDDLTIAVAVNTRDAEVGALVLFADVARAVFGEAVAAPEGTPVPAGVAGAVAGDYVGDRSRTSYRFGVEDGTVVRSVVEDGSDAPPVVDDGSDAESVVARPSRLPLVWIGEREFGRDDWPLDRFRFHPGSGRADAYSAYYNGLFDGFYVRVDG